MSNPIEGDENLPSREEIFVITHMMIHRLQLEGMENHVIAPVRCLVL